MKKKIISFAIILFALICAVYPIYFMVVKGGAFGHLLTSHGAKSMFIELFIWFLISVVGYKSKNALWIGLELLVFTYLHMMFLPMVAAIIYFCLLLMTGFLLQRVLFKEEGVQLYSIVLGMITLSVAYAVLSLLKIGSVDKLRIFDVVLLCILIAIYLKKQFLTKETFKRVITLLKVDSLMYVQLSIIMVFLMLIIGRANLSLDYDSAWYGARSLFCLDNMTGIYDDLKLVGCVYTYPKGCEVLMLPLSSVKTHAGIYSCNFFVTVGILFMAYQICRLFVKKERAMWGAVLLAAIPGVTNMALTAKPDSLTLLIQLFMVYYAIRFIKDRESTDLGLVLMMYIYTLTMKPTALVFSTSILLATIIIQIMYRIPAKINTKGLVYIIFSLVILFFIWLRTYLLTGIPATSIFGRLFRAIGMSEKYPFSSGQISQFRAESLVDPDVLHGSLIRIKEFMFAPNSADTDHIALAWGTSLCSFLIITVLICGLFDIKRQVELCKKDASYTFIWALLVGEFFGCLLSLWALSKPDGNYFMLYYSTTVIGSVVLYDCFLEHHMVKKVCAGMCMLIFVIVNVFFTGAATWSWVHRFTELNWLNRGYWDVEKTFRLYMKDCGCDNIYQIITKDPSTKVFAFGLHPDIERIPCVIESELDVYYWGNSELTSSYDNFKRFMDYEDYDFVLVQSGYLNKESIGYSYLCEMIDEGYFGDVTIENGHILLKTGRTDSNSLIKEKFIAMFNE